MFVKLNLICLHADAGDATQQIAELLGDDDSFLQIPCGQLDYAKIFGYSEMFKGDGQGMIPRFLLPRQNKWTVILFDELEKIKGWDPKGFLEALYQLLDEGTMRDQSNKHKGEISARKCIFVITSNKGEREVLQEMKNKHRSPEERRRKLNSVAGRAFEQWTKSVLGSDALNGRIDKICAFLPFTPDECELLVEDQIRRKVLYYKLPPSKDLKEKTVGDINVRVHDSVKRKMMAAINPSEGYRSVRKVVADFFENPVIGSLSLIEDAGDDEVVWVAMGEDGDAPEIFYNKRDMLQVHGALDESLDDAKSEPPSSNGCSDHDGDETAAEVHQDESSDDENHIGAL